MSAAEQQVAQEAAAKKPKTEYVAVLMTDGRTVQFPQKRSLQKQSFIPGEDGYTDAPMVRLDYSNGQTRQVFLPGGEILMELLGADAGIDAKVKHFMKAALHGYEQKLGDEMAYTPKKDEPEPTLEDKISWVDELIARLGTLEWSTAREGGGLAGAADLTRALVELSGKTLDEIQTFLRTSGKDAEGKPAPLTREERAAIKRTPAIKAKIEEYENERAKAKGISGDALLGGLGIVGTAVG